MFYFTAGCFPTWNVNPVSCARCDINELLELWVFECLDGLRATVSRKKKYGTIFCSPGLWPRSTQPPYDGTMRSNMGRHMWRSSPEDRHQEYEVPFLRLPCVS